MKLAPTMENLPDETLSDIFTRVLAKQLAQIRCVCKSWNSLLSESSFIKSHLQRSIHNNNGILLLLNRDYFFDHRQVTKCFTGYPNLEPELSNFINFPLNPQNHVIGSMDGLICFCRRKFPWPSCNYDICISNPSLSAMLTLPPCYFPSDCMGYHSWFGFDPKTNDYKVFILTSSLNGYNLVLQAEVYSMKKGSWKSISQMIPSHVIRRRGHNNFVINENHGHIHWLCDTHIDTDMMSKRQTILSFDLSEETFSEIPSPDSILDYNVNRTNVLGVLKGKLCVMSCVKDGECEVWMMDEYGVAKSWAKHPAFYKLSGDIVPYGFTSRGELLFKVDICNDDFCLYDPVEAKTKTFKIMDGYVIAKIVEYVDSLVWVPRAMQA